MADTTVRNTIHTVKGWDCGNYTGTVEDANATGVLVIYNGMNEQGRRSAVLVTSTAALETAEEKESLRKDYGLIGYEYDDGSIEENPGIYADDLELPMFFEKLDIPEGEAATVYGLVNLFDEFTASADTKAINPGESFKEAVEEVTRNHASSPDTESLAVKIVHNLLSNPTGILDADSTGNGAVIAIPSSSHKISSKSNPDQCDDSDEFDDFTSRLIILAKKDTTENGQPCFTISTTYFSRSYYNEMISTELLCDDDIYSSESISAEAMIHRTVELAQDDKDAAKIADAIREIAQMANRN
ncbi:hypothetical protein [Bifidobacterium sp. ESL0764]|uniref:hypothetical protein n=1 Tax=Bifidobacterium sp. ESL0764 TaxID=2983228 RepID=UPI0023F946FC|nr:hypothetical protein [Bifidobacterium sp. ESL0764]WEV66005.1 hypothetical protein OZX71_01195 [Bifidobacterium sp. ESL0764]